MALNYDTIIKGCEDDAKKQERERILDMMGTTFRCGNVIRYLYEREWEALKGQDGK